MTAISALQTVVLSKLGSKLDEKTVPPGEHAFDFTVRVSGRAVKGKNSDQKPTSRGLTMETLALFIQRSGIQREKALEILVEVMRDNIVLGDDQKVALLEITGVKAAKDRLDKEMESLPRTPKAGAFSIKEIKIEALDGEIVGDSFVPHAKQPDPVIPEITAEDA